MKNRFMGNLFSSFMRIFFDPTSKRSPFCPNKKGPKTLFDFMPWFSISVTYISSCMWRFYFSAGSVYNRFKTKFCTPSVDADGKKKSTVDVKGCCCIYCIGTRRKERVVLSNPFAKTALTHQSPLSQERRRMWGKREWGGDIWGEVERPRF